MQYNWKIVLVLLMALAGCKSTGSSLSHLSERQSRDAMPPAGSWGYCGTDVTSLLDSSLQKLQEKWHNLHVDDKIAVCSSMASAGGWDINEFFLAGWGNRNEKGAKYTNFFASGNWGQGQCAGTVTYHGQCYWAAELNYILWGSSRRMCDDYQKARAIDKTPQLGVTGYYYRIAKSSYGVGGETTPAYPLEMSLSLVRTWRMLKYGILEGRILETSQPKYRRTGLGTEERIAWTEAGWHAATNLAEWTNISGQCTPSDEVYNRQLLIFIGATTSKGTATLSGQFSATDASINLIPFGDIDQGSRGR